MTPQRPSLLSSSELTYHRTTLSSHPPLLPDARKPTTFRPMVPETDLLPAANGSARLCFADGTEAIVGVKAEVEKTGDDQHGNVDHRGRDAEMVGAHARDGGDRREEEAKEKEKKKEGEDGWIEVTVDIPGQRDDDAMVVFLAQMLQEGLVADGRLKNRLVINSRWHWRLFVDVNENFLPPSLLFIPGSTIVRSFLKRINQLTEPIPQILLLSPPHTYPLPLLSLTTHLALLSARLPALISSHDEDPLFDDDWDASIPLYPPTKPPIGKGNDVPSSATEMTSTRPPITLLVTAIASNIFFDPTHAELAVADAVLAITVAASSSIEVDGPQLLAVRTIDLPSTLSTSASEREEQAKGGAEGGCKARKGGMSRGMLKKMVARCVDKGGVGEEVLNGLLEFT